MYEVINTLVVVLCAVNVAVSAWIGDWFDAVVFAVLGAANLIVRRMVEDE